MIEEEKRFYNEEKNFQISSIEQSPILLHTDTNSLDWNYVFSKLKRDHFCIRNATNFRDIARWKNIEKLPYQKNNFQIDAFKSDHSYIRNAARILEILHDEERKRFPNTRSSRIQFLCTLILIHWIGITSFLN